MVFRDSWYVALCNLCDMLAYKYGNMETIITRHINDLWSAQSLSVPHLEPTDHDFSIKERCLPRPYASRLFLLPSFSLRCLS